MKFGMPYMKIANFVNRRLQTVIKAKALNLLKDL